MATKSQTLDGTAAVAFFDDLIDEAQAAVMLRVNPKTLRRYRAHRGLAFIKVGRRVLYRRSTIAAWLLAAEHEDTRRL